MPTATEHRKLAAIMFTDMVGYSALAQRNEALALELLEEHRRLVRAILPQHGGREVKTTGDGFLIEFPSALAAVQCAIDVQAALHARNLAEPEERQARIRIGIHVGDVVMKDGDVHGDGVNLAARIEPLAGPGGIVVSRAVHEQVGNKLETPLAGLGRAELKNIEGGVEVFRMVLPWQRGAPARVVSGWQRRCRQAVPWAVAMLATGVALAALLTNRRGSPTAGSDKGRAGAAPVRRFEIVIPLPKRGGAFTLQGLAISPDGRKLAYANADGLWVRRLDQLAPPILISTAEKALMPFWSPRDTDVAWFEPGTLKRAPASGGRPVTICQIETNAVPWDHGGAWFENDEIILSTGLAGLERVSAQGGSPKVALAPAEGEGFFGGVSALGNGRGVVFDVCHIQRKDENLVGSIDTIAAWDPRDGKNGKKILLQRPGARITKPVYSSSGHIVFRDMQSGESDLWALSISLSTLETTGESFRLTEIAGGLPSVSDDGTLVFVQRDSNDLILAPRQLVWVERSGRVGTPFGPIQKGLRSPRLSPDERFVAFSAGGSLTVYQTWILNLTAGSAVPLRPEGEYEQRVYWLPNGREIVVEGNQNNSMLAIIRSVEGDHATKATVPGLLLHVSRSGKYAFLRRREGPNIANVYVQLSGDRSQQIPLPGGSPNLVNILRLRPSLSPDDATLAFQSEESGQREVWAVAFPGFTNRVIVSRGGGTAPQWSRDGKELFFLSEDGYSLMAAPFLNQADRLFGPPVKICDLPATIYAGEAAVSSSNIFDPSADGQRFLMMHNVRDPETPEKGPEPRVLLIENWFEEFRSKK